MGKTHVSTLLLALALLGCGGHGSSSASATPSLAPFVGTWSGPYGLAGQASEGTATIMVAAPSSAGAKTAAVTGTATNAIQGVATVTGHIAVGPGAYSVFLFDYPYVQVPYELNAKIDAAGHLVLTPSTVGDGDDDKSYDQFDLAPVAATASARRR